MNGLTNEQLTRLNIIISKIQSRTASTAEMQDFLLLIQTSGQNNWIEFQNYLHIAGYSNIDEFKQHLNQKQDFPLLIWRDLQLMKA